MKSKYNPDNMLMDVLDFTDDDLAANQDGVLSEHQRAILQKKRLLSRIIPAGILITGILLGILIMPNMLAFVVIGCGILFAVATFTDINRRTVSTKLSVSKVMGIVKLDARELKNGYSFYIQINRHRFQVTQAMMLAFKSGDSYAIYHIGNQILSAEWIQ